MNAFRGPERNIIRFIPPLTISDGELEQALDILEQAIGTAEMRNKNKPVSMKSS